MEDIIYVISFHDGKEQEVLEKRIKGFINDTVDDIVDEISSIRKNYRLFKTTYRLTLYTSEHSFEATEYISHYQSLPKDKYGSNFLSAFDIELINKLNF
jgi:hypothetical protein